MIVFDVEADNLLEDATKIHCLSYTSDGSDVKTIFTYPEMRTLLLSQKGLIGHNIVRYDIPLLEKLLGIRIKARLFDTLPMSWVLNTNRGKHGLDSFGQDFGVPKPKVDDWVNLTQEEYAHRCQEDVKINWLLWQNLLKRFIFIYKDKAQLDKFFRYLQFKMDCAASAEASGWRLDIDLAKDCIDKLTKEQDYKTRELCNVMPLRKLFKVQSKPKVCYKKDDTLSSHGKRWFKLLDEYGLPSTYTGEVTVVKGAEPANPNSTDQVKDWLTFLGWKPCTYKYNKNKDTGQEKKVPQVRKNGELTESVRLLIDQNPAVEILDGLTIIQHRLAIFQGFIDCERDGYVKAEIDGLTNTLRFKHKKPLVNLPGVDKPWGKEIRSCLIAPDDHVLCGADMTSLEDTTKRHYMKPYDPEYVKEMSQDGFDPHLDLAKHAGAITQEQIDQHNSGTIDLKALRKNYKVVNYSATYGVGAAKLSRETGMDKEDAQSLLDAYWQRNWSVKEFSESQPIRHIQGDMWIQNPVSKFWHSLRFEKDAFSTINQSTGSYCFDRWVALYRTTRSNIIGQFHDESINIVRKGYEHEHTSILNSAISKLNSQLKLNVDLGIDVQYGKKLCRSPLEGENKMATRKVKLVGIAEWAKVFPQNRDHKGYEGAYEDSDGACTVDLIMDDSNLSLLQASRSMKKGTPDKDGRGTKVKFVRKYDTGLDWNSGPPVILKSDDTKWDLDVDGFIGNGSKVEVHISVYDTKYKDKCGTRLDKIKVLELERYVTPDDDSPPPPQAVVADDAVLF